MTLKTISSRLVALTLLLLLSASNVSGVIIKASVLRSKDGKKLVFL